MIRRPKTVFSGFEATGSVLKHARVALALGTAISAGYYLLPGTVLKNALREFVQFDEEEIPLSKDLADLVEQVKDDLKLDPSEKELVKSFVTSNLTSVHIGSLLTAFGVDIAIPFYLNFSRVEDATMDLIEAPHIKMQKTEKDLLPIRESLVLSDNAKRYCIARAIMRSKDSDFIMKGVVTPLVFVATCYGSTLLVRSAKLAGRPYFLRLPIYFVSGLLGLTIQAFCVDYISYTNDVEIESKLSSLGPNYVAGGCEFYDKILTRNKLLAQLYDDSDICTEEGNPVMTRPLSMMPFSERLEFYRNKSG